MRLAIRHQIDSTFADPVRNLTRILRLTPRSHEGQHVASWQIDVDVDCVLRAGEDGYGNLTHTFTAKGPIDRLSVTVTGEVDNFDAAGVVRGSAERMPTELFLRETPLTAADDALRRFALDIAAAEATTLGRLHALQDELNEAVGFAEDTADLQGAAETFGAGRGGGVGLAHAFTACARLLGIPSRVTGGYYLCEDQARGIRHAWSPAVVEGRGGARLGAAHKTCPQESHVRLATGLDGLAAAGVRGVDLGAVVERLDMRTRFETSWTQSQSQGPGWQRQSQGGGFEGG